MADLKEIYLYGVRRSGNHAIINYIAGHVVKDRSEYDKVWSRFCFIRDRINYKISSKSSEKIRKDLPFPYPRFGDTQIISHENEQIKHIFSGKKKHILYSTGREKTVKMAIVLLRDPYNTMASLLYRLKVQKNIGISILEYIHNEFDLWIKCAELFFVDNDKKWLFPLNYNKWFVDREYRIEISNFINQDHTDFGKDRVTSLGSSFDVLNYRNKAYKMKVLNRWECLEKPKNKKYRDIFDQKPELRELSKKIFDVCPF